MSHQLTLGRRITDARENAGLTIDQLAQSAAISGKTLKNWETDRTLPRPNKLQMLSGVLGVSLTWLLDGGDAHDPVGSRPSRLDQLESKVERMHCLQRELFQLSNEISQELAAIRKIDERTRRPGGLKPGPGTARR